MAATDHRESSRFQGRRGPPPQRDIQNVQANNGEGVQCRVCNSVLSMITQSAFQFKFNISLKEWSEGSKKARQKHLQNFLKMVNTLCNEGGGFVLIHTEQQYLTFFDEQVDDRLMSMIPDGSMFDENFRTKRVDDQHVSFQVLPSNNRQLCVLDFHSTISLNKGRAKPDYRQMKHLLNRAPPFSHYSLSSPFKAERLVRGDIVPFIETRNMQAKLIMDRDMELVSGTSRGEKLLSLSWEKLDLPDFISGFSKQKEGGHYCLGLEEEKKCEGQRWRPVEGTDTICELLKMKKKLWENKDNTTILYLAEEGDVPTYEYRTGRFILRGVRLSCDDQEKFELGLKNKLQCNMFCFPPSASLQVKCLFHKVLEPAEDNLVHKDLYLVEVQVEYYSGVCFHDIGGPEVYQYRNRQNGAADAPVRVPGDECCHRLRNST